MGDSPLGNCTCRKDHEARVNCDMNISHHQCDAIAKYNKHNLGCTSSNSHIHFMLYWSYPTLKTLHFWESHFKKASLLFLHCSKGRQQNPRFKWMEGRFQIKVAGKNNNPPHTSLKKDQVTSRINLPRRLVGFFLPDMFKQKTLDRHLSKVLLDSCPR